MRVALSCREFGVTWFHASGWHYLRGVRTVFSMTLGSPAWPPMRSVQGALKYYSGCLSDVFLDKINILIS